tara:strand:+ start:330 stop:515 length:186 start_codon:yes stop_codon:yes gene_type:complete
MFFEIISVFIASALGVVGGFVAGEVFLQARRRREIDRTVQELLDQWSVEQREEAKHNLRVQ